MKLSQIYRSALIATTMLILSSGLGRRGFAQTNSPQGELGFAIGRMGQLVTALAGFSPGSEQTVHGADGAVILSLIEQSRIDRGGRAILEAFLAEISQDGFPFRRSQGASRPRPRSDMDRGRTRTSIPVVGPRGTHRARQAARVPTAVASSVTAAIETPSPDLRPEADDPTERPLFFGRR
jgi:hypothetical protein